MSSDNQDVIQLSPNDQERLAEFLINPPELSFAMLRAKETHDTLIKSNEFIEEMVKSLGLPEIVMTALTNYDCSSTSRRQRLEALEAIKTFQDRLRAKE